MTGIEGFEIDVATLRTLRASGASVAIVDVREPWEYEICAIDGGINIPMQQLPARMGELAAGGALVVLCHHGMRSLQAVAWLRQQGYDNAVSLQGGIDAWAAEVEPTMGRY